jgi:hypothetical protein
MSIIAFNKHTDQDDRGLKAQRAKLIYLFSDSTNLRCLGKFLIDCADEMKKKKPFHRHFRDSTKSWHSNFVDVVVERHPMQTKS